MEQGLVTTWLRALFGYQVLTLLGVPVPQRTILEVEGAATLADDPLNQRTILTVGGSGTSPTFGAISGTSLTLGNYSALPQPAVPTTSNATVNLLTSPIPIPAGSGVRIRATLIARIQTGSTPFYMQAAVGIADYGRPASGSASVAWTGGVETDVPTYPWSTRNAPTTITGATSDGGTQVKIAVVDASSWSAGNTITIAGAVTTGGLVLNRQWIVDSVPDGTHLVLRGSTWTGGWSSGGTVTPNGALLFVLSSNAVQITATGISAAPWQASESVHGGEFRSNANGTYVYTNPGTTSGTGPGPSGTTTGTDGSASYAYVGAGTNVPITWQVFVETWTT